MSEGSPAHTFSWDGVFRWLDRRFYRDAPLATVIGNVQLYTPRRIELDPALAGVRFTGLMYPFDSREAEQWVRNLTILWPVEIKETSQSMAIRCVTRGCPGIAR